jgi:hypothetical protein
MAKPTDAEVWGLTLLAASEVPNFLAGMAPSLFTLQHFTDKSEADRKAARDSMHRAYIVGGGLSLLVGAGASLVSGSWYPFAACAIVLVVLVVQYEWALETPHANGEVM